MLIANDHSDTVAQDVTILIHGANDAPAAAVDDHIITNHCRRYAVAHAQRREN